MSLRQLVFPKNASGQTQTAKNQTRFRSRSFGKLPRLSKDLMYESVQNQPLPQSPLSTPRPASILSSPAPSNVSPSLNGNDYFAERSGSPTPRASRSTTMQSGGNDSVYAGGHHTMSLPKVEAPNEEDTSSWMQVFSRSKRGSKIFHRDGDGDMIDGLAKSAHGGSQSPSKRFLKSPPTTPIRATFSEGAARADSEERSNRRSSIFESIPLPSLSAVRFANKRHSIATASSQGDDYPGTPDLSGNGSRYTPVSEFGLPRDPFGKYNPPLDGKPSQEPHDRNLGAVEDAHNSLQRVAGSSDPRRTDPTVSRWVYPSPPESPSHANTVFPVHQGPQDSPKDSSERQAASYYIPVHGLNFPLPPTCTTGEVSEMSGRGIRVHEFQSSVLSRQNIRAYDFAYDPSPALYRSPTVGSPFIPGLRLPPGIYFTKGFTEPQRIDPELERQYREEEAVLESFDFLLGTSPRRRKASKSDAGSRKPNKMRLQSPEVPNLPTESSSDVGHGQQEMGHRRNFPKKIKRKSISGAIAHGGAFFSRLTHG